MPVTERNLKRMEEVFITISSLAAYIAPYVVAMLLLCEMVNESIDRFALIDAPELFKETHRAFDGGLVDPWHLRLDNASDIFGSQAGT